MNIKLTFRELDHWIEVGIQVNGVELELSQNTLTFDELETLFRQILPTKIRIDVQSDKDWLISRSSRVCNYLKNRCRQLFSALQFQITYKKTTKQGTMEAAYKKGLLSYLTGVYPTIPLSCIKHIFVPIGVEAEESHFYLRKTAINSAIIIEVSEAEEMKKMYERLASPQIVHFKLNDQYYLNYPFGKKVKLPFGETYQLYQDLTASKQLISLEIGDGLRRSPDFFGKEGGISMNKIMLSSSGHFKLNENLDYHMFEMDSVITKDIPFISKIRYESSRFARLCGLTKYQIVGEKNGNIRFSDGLIEKVLDIYTYQVN